MLCLSRRVGEVIHIGKDIKITVLHMERGKVKLGIDAPRDMDIYREEIVEKPNFKPRDLPKEE